MHIQLHSVVMYTLQICTVIFKGCSIVHFVEFSFITNYQTICAGKYTQNHSMWMSCVCVCVHVRMRVSVCVVYLCVCT